MSVFCKRHSQDNIVLAAQFCACPVARPHVWHYSALGAPASGLPDAVRMQIREYQSIKDVRRTKLDACSCYICRRADWGWESTIFHVHAATVVLNPLAGPGVRILHCRCTYRRYAPGSLAALASCILSMFLNGSCSR